MLPGLEEPACHLFSRAIEACSVPNDPNFPPEKRFYPKTRLIELCTPERVSEVLGCRCATCMRHLGYAGSSCSPEEAADLIIGESVGSSYAPLVLTFCLLVYIKCPQFIVLFLRNRERFNDNVLSTSQDFCDINFIRQQVWPDQGQRDHTQSSILADLAQKLRWEKYKFFLPPIESGKYSEYDSSTILPFVQEQPLGGIDESGHFIQDEGGYGKVFSFGIQEEYKLLPGATNITKFARKELFGTTPARFHAEIRNLELVKRLGDQHLIQILKAYKHGDKFNIVFPCARTNLGAYLRYSRFGAPLVSDGRIESSPLWLQLLGVAKGLDKIINYSPPHLKPGEPPLYGYHLDLKPANILVEDSGNLIISDFGQARFQKSGGTSRITPFGGTETYAPPEIDVGECKPNRKYDIWSLGCVFLEVCTFLVMGHDGLRQFDRQRIIQRGNIKDDRFFSRKASRDGYEIKSQIVKWMDMLSSSPTNNESKDFMREVIALVRQMLDVEISTRAASQDVCHVLAGILDRYRPAQLSPSLRSSDDLELSPEDIEYGKGTVPQIQSMMYYKDEAWKAGPLRLIERSDHEMQIITIAGSEDLRLDIGRRGQAKVVPRYASHCVQHQAYNDCHLYFSSSDAGSTIFLNTKLYFQQVKDAIRFHSAIASQDIRLSINLPHFSFEKLPPIVRRFGGIFSLPNKTQPKGGGVASTIQLWSEHSYRDPAANLRHRSRFSVRQQYFSGAAPRRIVIYQESSILIVRLAKNARIERRSGKGDTTSLKIIPTDKSRDSSFKASLLSASQQEATVGLPISIEYLRSEEERFEFECKMVELNFGSEDHLKEFFRCYKTLKKEWKSEEEDFQDCRKNMGEVLGYAPD